MSSPTTRPRAASIERAVQRLIGAAWLLVCGVLGWIAWGYHSTFSYEPVGPRAYPLLCLALMALGLVWLVARPPPLQHDADDVPLSAALLRKVGTCVLVLLGFAALFERLGFIVASAIAGTVLAWLAGGRPWPSLAAGLVLGAGLYLLFDRILEVPLPAGVLAPLLGGRSA